MSITASQIFVRTGDVERLLKAVEAYLARWAREVGGSWPDVPFLGSDTARTTRALPPKDGWCCLVDPDAYRVDLDLAQAVSSALSASAVAIELRGGELVWSYTAYDSGSTVREERDPLEAFSPGRGEGPMPMYSDVTREALKVLQSEGIPQEYWLLRFDDLVEGAPPQAEGVLWLDEIVTAPQRKDAVSRSLRSPFSLRRLRGSVMFRPDVEGSTPDTTRLLVEIRTLFGRPNHQVVDQLLEIERADTNRLLAPFMGKSTADVPAVQFEYSSPAISDQEFREMLARRRKEYLGSRPTEHQFLGLAVAAAREEHPEWVEVRPDGFGIRFKRKSERRAVLPAEAGARVGGAGLADARIDLAGAYADYMAGRLVAETPRKAASGFLSKAASDLERAPETSAFDTVADLLLPSLVSADEGARLEADGVATRPLGHGVKIVLACQVGKGTALIEKRDLETWGVPYYEALRIARSNLARQTPELAKALLPVEISPGMQVLADLSGGSPATRILLPGLHAALRQLLDTDEAICAIPDLDSFFVARSSDPATRAELRAFARERLLAAEKPLTTELFRIRRDSVEEA